MFELQIFATFFFFAFPEAGTEYMSLREDKKGKAVFQGPRSGVLDSQVQEIVGFR